MPWKEIPRTHHLRLHVCMHSISTVTLVLALMLRIKNTQTIVVNGVRIRVFMRPGFTGHTIIEILHCVGIINYFVFTVRGSSAIPPDTTSSMEFA